MPWKVASLTLGKVALAKQELSCVVTLFSVDSQKKKKNLFKWSTGRQKLSSNGAT